MAPRAKHVLIVDDYPDALEISVIYLQASGYRVSTGADGRTAVAQTEKLLPDVMSSISNCQASRALKPPLACETVLLHKTFLDLPEPRLIAQGRTRTAPSAFALRQKSAAGDRVDPETLVSQPGQNGYGAGL